MTANTHLPHLSELLFTEPDFVLEFINSIHREDYHYTLSLKYDGAPSVVFGTDPSNNQFFISTKSIFNKNRKLFYNTKDIIESYYTRPDLMNKLLHVYSYLEPHKNKFNKIYQADLMALYSDLIKTDDEVSFKPNTINYKIQRTSSYYGTNDLFYKVLDSKIILAAHTEYSSLESPQAEPLSSELNVDSSVLFLNPNVIDVSEFKKKVHNDFSMMNSHPALEFMKNVQPQYQEYLKQYFNYCIKEHEYLGSNSVSVENFIDFISSKFHKKILSLKTIRGKSKSLSELSTHVQFISDNYESFKRFMSYYVDVDYIVVNLNHRLLYCVNDKVSISGTIGDTKKLTHEGYVVTVPGKPSFKIVDRTQFSAENFANGRFQ